MILGRVRRFICAIPKTIDKYPLTVKFTVASVVVAGSWVVYRVGPISTNQKITKRLRDGSDPLPKEEHSKGSSKYIDRPDVVKSIHKLLFESDPDNGKIGFILGPKGSGKSRAVMEACSTTPGPSYILYQEVYQISQAAEQLAHAAGFPRDRNIVDRIYQRLFQVDSLDVFYYFPKDTVQAITYVLNKIARKSKEAIKEHDLNRLPCFVIDATELLALHEPETLNTLLRLANYYARAKKMRIVLVDSDGITLSKINQSLKYPKVDIDIVEVKDLADKDAENYLRKQTKMSNDLAKRLVRSVGGRLLHLGCVANFYQKLYGNNLDDDLIYNIIDNWLYTRFVAPINDVIINNAPVSEHIIECFISEPALFPSILKKQLYAHPAEVQHVIDALVNANLFRYNAW